jgi:integrase
MRMARRKAHGEYWWYAVLKEPDGRWTRISLRTQDRREAERNFHLLLSERQKEAAPSLTIADVWREYWTNHAQHLPSAATRKTVWARLRPFWGDRFWDAVNETTCREYQTARLSAGVTSATVWSELKSLRSALGYCAKRGAIPSLPHIWLPPAPRPRDKRLTREQAEALIAACHTPHIRLFVILALTTAGRMTAILDLTWDRVDFERGIIELELPTRDRKNKRAARVPMNRLARAALQEARDVAMTDRVVEWGGHSVRSVQKSVQRAGEAIGYPGLSPHVLRHTAASLMVEAGVPIEAVGQYLGHAAVALTYSTYARYSPTALRDAASALEFGTVREVKKKPLAK